MDRCESWFGKEAIRSSTHEQGNFKDRFIPYRPELNVESAHMQLFSRSPNEKSLQGGVESPGVKEYSRRLSVVLNEQQGILPTHGCGSTCNSPSRPTTTRRSSTPWLMDLGDEVFSSPSPRAAKRHVSTAPDRVLDMPGLRDDFYCNVLDWGPNGCIAVALGANTYVWNVKNEECKRLRLHLPELDDFYVSSVAWSKVGETLAIGTCQGDILLWDATSMKVVKNFRTRDHCHVGSISWSKDKLMSGSRKGRISIYDPRDPVVCTSLSGHKRDVTNLKLSTDEEFLASGGDDGIVNIWSMRNNSVYRRIESHKACAKALAWCPWRPSVIASGGGSNDGHIRLWHVHTGEKLTEVDTKSQVCSLLWSSVCHELVSSHGVPNADKNSIHLWRTRLMKLEQTTRLQQHSRRPLHLAISPDGTTLASLGADENLCLWRCFPSSTPRTSSTDHDSPLQLTKSIR
ncbi:cell division cycle protein 20 homolog [Haliotis asinina]|uniref:cell division cycle protein 20 homolog n=1 Tax=Haliotis asinina TaxID=109174 RepID=UPI003531D70C